MTTNIATTREQSRRLQQCGVDPKTADMSIRTITEPYLVEDVMWHTPELKTLPYSEAKVIYGNDEITPAWSLSALLELLPKKIMNGVSRIYTVEIAYSHTFNDAPWTINYEGNGLNKNAHFNGKSPIEACVKAIEWLTANNYKLNEL